MNANAEKLQKINQNGFILKLMNVFTEKKVEQASEEVELLNMIDEAKRALDCAKMNFEEAKEKEIIDHYIYSIKACEAKYEYLMREAKRRGLRAGINRLIS
ncbi:MAG TPA: YaaL family protein [Clostridiaceae bacterium]|nr:YaaL family protein [Clostridiaceae bacterium]